LKNEWIISAAVGISLLGFGSGFFTGQRFPVHHYTQFAQSSYLYDMSTGRVCTITRSEIGAPPPGFVLDGTKDANGFEVVKPNPSSANPLGFPNPMQSSRAPSEYPICGEWGYCWERESALAIVCRIFFVCLRSLDRVRYRQFTSAINIGY